MKILFTSHRFFPEVGGIETFSDVFARFLVARGHEVLLVTQSQAPSTAEERSFDFQVLRRPTSSLLLRSYRNTDVVFQNNIELRSLWPWPIHRVPLVISVQTWLRQGERRRTVDILKKFFLHLADHVVCPSEALRKDSCLKSSVIPNPFEDGLFREMPDVDRDSAIVFLGRLVSDKGVDLLIEAFSMLVADKRLAEECKRQGYGLRLGIIGDGPERKALESLVSAKKLGRHVQFFGSLVGNELVRLLNRHRVIAIPSRWREPFGIVALEGMACGCVPVGSDGGGLRDAIGSAGCVFERGSSRDLAEKLRALFLNPDLLKQMRQHTKLHLDVHRSEAVCGKYLDILHELVRGKR